MTVSLGHLSAALLKAAIDGRLSRVEGVYLWRPRTAVSRSISSPGMAEAAAQMVAFGLILPPQGDDTVVLVTQRGRDAWAAHLEGGPAVADTPPPPKPDEQPAERPSAPGNPGRALGKALKEVRKENDATGKSGRRR